MEMGASVSQEITISLQPKYLGDKRKGNIMIRENFFYIYMLLLLFFISTPLLDAYMLEETPKASINRFDPQNSKWTVELWNKTRKPIFAVLSYDPTYTKAILSFSLKPQKKIRSDYFTGIPFYMHIWHDAEVMPNTSPTIQKKINAVGKTAYLSYEKKGRQYILRPQKGDGVKTQSGLFIIHNVIEQDSTNVESQR
jgi:hypothetical protein